MPLVNVDVKSLELFVAADWYDDKVLKNELLQKIDLHAENQERWKLPSRVLAKIFVFKLIYGASAFGYANDPDFMHLGLSQKAWQRVIDDFYSKYQGIYKGHIRDTAFVKENGYLEIPSGRYYNYKPKQAYNGWKWPITTIKNYPVQGFGAELVKLARVEAYKRFKSSGMEGYFICTVHDSLVFDVPGDLCYNICMLLKDCIEATPLLCKEWFDYEFSLPIWCEILVGQNKKDMTEFKF